jgi:hypothetical protein
VLTVAVASACSFSRGRGCCSAGLQRRLRQCGACGRPACVSCGACAWRRGACQDRRCPLGPCWAGRACGSSVCVCEHRTRLVLCLSGSLAVLLMV